MAALDNSSNYSINNKILLLPQVVVYFLWHTLPKEDSVKADICLIGIALAAEPSTSPYGVYATCDLSHATSQCELVLPAEWEERIQQILSTSQQVTNLRFSPLNVDGLKKFLFDLQTVEPEEVVRTLKGFLRDHVGDSAFEPPTYSFKLGQDSNLPSISFVNGDKLAIGFGVPVGQMHKEIDRFAAILRQSGCCWQEPMRSKPRNTWQVLQRLIGREPSYVQADYDAESVLVATIQEAFNEQMAVFRHLAGHYYSR